MMMTATMTKPMPMQDTAADTADRTEPGATPHHILIIDDDARLRDLIAGFLVGEGYRVSKAESAATARALMEGIRPDLLVVDIMMEGESGLDLVRTLKTDAAAPPCLMLTAMGAPGERLHGLESGADDYMTKPFEPQELALRIRNILGRAAASESERGRAQIHEVAMGESGQAITGDAVAFGPHVFETARRILTTGGKRQHLTGTEKDLLGCFCAAPNHVLSREDISTRLGGQMTGRSIDVAIARLRRKIEPNPGKPIYLLTVRGLGWMLECDNRAKGAAGGGGET